MKATLLFSLKNLLFSFLLLGMVFIGQEVHAQSVKAVTAKVKSLADQNDNASPKVKAFIKGTLVTIMTNPVLVSAVKSQNARGISMSDIKKIDDEWKAAEDFLEIHDEMMSSKCADEIRNLAKKYNAIGETFLMDNQGANVCQNELTGDYWQGDEAKWKNSFNNGSGGLDVGTESFDSSSNTVLQQVSLPIVDNSGKVVGAICFGLMTGRL